MFRTIPKSLMSVILLSTALPALSDEVMITGKQTVVRQSTTPGHGRVLAMGGGGHNRRNLARAWTRVVQALAA